jgi:ABC-2 type transport system permease protein
VWLAYARGAVIAYLGDELNLARAVQALSPFHLIGSPPIQPVDTANAVLLGVLTVGLLGLGLAGFRRRAIPQA